MESTSEVINQDSIQERIEKYSMFGNDSSDEEDEVVSYDGAKAVTKLEEFNNDYKCASKFGHNNLSFICHAIAIKFLYSTNIQKAYYIQKKWIKNSFEVPDHDKLKKGIEKAAEHIVDFRPELQQKEVQDVISKKIYENLEEFFDALINGELPQFFEELTDPDGNYRYKKGDLLGWRYPDELGKLCASLPERSNLLDVSQSDNFSIGFFSTLRLHNRLDKRKIRNGIVNSIHSEWKYSDSAKVIIQHGTESRNNYRMEWVTFGEHGAASYETIYEKFPLTMRDIDQLPEIFTKGANQISDNAATLHYLLFGTEVMRNPSALIHNMMILDLLKGGKLTWKNAFMDNVMPMSVGGAIMATRIKNSAYNEKYMPHKYLYEHKTYAEYSSNWDTESPHKRSISWDEKNRETATELLNKEQDLTKRWLEMKFGEKCVEWFDEETGDVKMECVKSMFDMLQRACQDWYNVDLVADAADIDTRGNKRKRKRLEFESKTVT